MAIPELSFEEGGHLERRLIERAAAHRNGGGDPRTATIPFPVRVPSVRFADDLPEAWFAKEHEKRAYIVLDELETALEHGRTRRAERLRNTFLGIVHADRLARVHSLANTQDLRLDPTGHGPVFHRPALYLRDRLPWWIRPVDAHTENALPERARHTLLTWERHDNAFDAYYHADEPTGGSPVPCHSLIGVLSPDALTGDWFILDRWGS